MSASGRLTICTMLGAIAGEVVFGVGVPPLLHQIGPHYGLPIGTVIAGTFGSAFVGAALAAAAWGRS